MTTAPTRLMNERRSDSYATTFEEMIGSSAALNRLLIDAAKVAPTDTPVLITGEFGTGKELLARAIHASSRRMGQSFITVTCAAIPPAPMAAEGKFELARGGTIFLDEVGDLSLAQPRRP